MANSDLAREYCTPPINPTTGGHLPYGCGDSEWIFFRKQADGVVANASTLCNQQIKPNGWMNIQGCSHLIVKVSAYKGSVPLDSISLQPVFGLDQSVTTYDSLAVLDWTADTEEVTVLVSPFLYLFTATTTTLLLIVPNPGMPLITFYTSSVGTTTASFIDLKAVRGYGAAPMTKNVLG